MAGLTLPRERRRAEINGMGSGRTGRNVTLEGTGSFVVSVKGLFGRLRWGGFGSGTITFRSR
jgi:hypothetical protein